MKVGAECIPCLFERAKFECDLVFEEEEAKISVLGEVMGNIVPLLAPDAVPAALGTLRERIIRERSGIYDPHLDLKVASDGVARSLLPTVDAHYNGSDGKIEALFKIAAVANTMEYGVKGHDFHHSGFSSTFDSIMDDDFLYDDRITGAVESFDKVLYLTDNTGEVVFDEYVAKRLRDMDKEVVISPKSEPIINDATVEDLRRSGLFEDFDVVPSGSYVGVNLDEAPERFKKLFWDKDYLVIAKGMGYYETISEFQGELRGRLIYVLRAKCEPVARSIGVERGALTARLI
ncbi:MAG: DUF89 domain-containing protein [Candidatus Hydrothermarchaeaceae archaeon]